LQTFCVARKEKRGRHAPADFFLKFHEKATFKK
jgi:hypothetical protein